MDSATADPGPPARPAAATITAYPDGPLVVRGDFEVRELDGTVTQTGRVVALCRCGRSALKPICDGSHKHGVRRTNRAAADTAHMPETAVPDTAPGADTAHVDDTADAEPTADEG
jgi:CDGSH-type Zn-finger protein